MRKLLALAATAAVATVAFGAYGASPAQAQCPGQDGTVPTTGARMVAAGPFYVDDRDFADADDDGDAGGLWIYMESNSKPSLQRGGDQIAFTEFKARTGQDPQVPHSGPVVVPVASPTDPSKPVLTLFPSGVGGGSLSETAGSHDDCQQGGAPYDNIVF